MEKIVFIADLNTPLFRSVSGQPLAEGILKPQLLLMGFKDKGHPLTSHKILHDLSQPPTQNRQTGSISDINLSVNEAVQLFSAG